MINTLRRGGQGGNNEGGDEGGGFMVTFASSVPSPGSHGGCRSPPGMCSLAQLRSQQLLTNSDINKQSATLWMIIGGRGDVGIGEMDRGGMEWGCRRGGWRWVRMQDISANISSSTFALDAF